MRPPKALIIALVVLLAAAAVAVHYGLRFVQAERQADDYRANVESCADGWRWSMEAAECVPTDAVSF